MSKSNTLGTKARLINQIKKALPVLSIILALIFQLGIADSKLQKKAEKPYFTYFLFAILIIYITFYLISFFNRKIDKRIVYKGGFYAGVVLFLNILNIVTLKYAMLPTLFFPSLDRVFGTLVEDRAFLLKCIIYSLKLLLTGFI